MDDNNLEDEILEDLEPIRMKYSIKRAPSYNLRECLSFYTKQQLVDIAYEHGEYISMSKVKNAIIDILEEILISRIESDSLYFTISERDMLARFIEDGGLADNNLEKSISLKRLGYIYWFYNDNHFYAVCPDEIADRFMISYESNNENIIMRNNKMFDYINALQHLYGVFEIEQLLTVWNKYNKDKLDEQEALEFLNIVGRRQNYFWWDSPYIIADYFMHDGEYEEYLKNRSPVDYYIPSKEELEYYMENEFDEENIYYKKMMTFLKKGGQLDHRALDNISVAIEVSCTLDGPLQHIVDEMNDEGFIFDSYEEVNEFAQLHMNLSNNTRKWAIKGHKPVELTRGKSKSVKRDKKDNVIPFPQAGSTKTRKIGRNELCPCGSGKKYKFCCGR
jgi:hypothetical protein